MHSARVFAPMVMPAADMELDKAHTCDLYGAACQRTQVVVEYILNSQNIEQLYNAMKEFCSSMVSCPLPPLRFHQELAMFIRDLIAHPQTDPGILRIALLLISNIFSVNGSDQMQQSMFDVSIVQVVQNLFDRDQTIWKHILLVLGKIAALSEYGRNTVVAEFGFERLTYLISGLYPNDTDSAPYRSLLSSISRHYMNRDLLAQWITSLSSMAQSIGSLVLCPLSRIGKWIPIGAISEQLVPLCQHVLSVPSPKDEICAAMMVLSYANVPINELICEFAKSDDDTISATAIWYIGRHILKYPGDLQAVFATGIIESELSHLTDSAISRREESICFFCRVIEVTNALLPQEFLEAVGQGIAEIIDCTSDPSIILKCIRTMTILIDKHIINTDFAETIEDFSNHESDEIAEAARIYIDAVGS